MRAISGEDPDHETVTASDEARCRGTCSVGCAAVAREAASQGIT